MTSSKAVLRLFILVSALLLSSCRSQNQIQSTTEAGEARLRRLNLVVVTIDTLRPDRLHAYGYSKIATPNLDRIAQNGVLFEKAVAQSPLTPPSHASIFTGQYPNVHKVRNTGGFTLPSSARPLARLLQEQQWDTAAFVGSAVLKKQFGFSNGFAVYDDEMPRPGHGREFLEDPERPAEQVVDRAIEWLGAQSGKPYFLWVHVYDPHLPYQPPAPFREQYKDRPYDGEIAYTDQQLGRLFAAVQKKSPANDTVIAVLSDHGESLSEHGEYTHGVFLYDSTQRIVFLMSGPGIPAGARVKSQVRSIDFLPTILALMGGKPSAGLQGVSLLPAFAGQDVPTDIAYMETLYPKMNMGWAELRAIRTNRWKYVRAPKPELYDLANDPGENTNVLSGNPAEVQKLEAHLRNATALPGAGAVEKIENGVMDQRMMDQLKSLGYLGGFSPRQYELDGKGADPKDRLEILKLLDHAENPAIKIPDARRIELLRQALQQDPTNPALYYQLGGRYEKAGRHSEAVQLYQAAIKNGVESGKLHSRIADLSVRLGNKDLAILEYEKAAQLNPADLESQINLATAYLEKGRIADAERVFQWIVTSDPNHAAAHNGLGLIAMQKQDPARGRQHFESAVRSDPELVEAHMNLGLLYSMIGERARARKSFETFLAKASPAQYGPIIPKVRQELAQLQ